jgi:hypothetical protein
MESIRFRRWEVTCDPEATRKAYAVISMGGTEECGCEPCLNFVAARIQAYSPDVLSLFEKLGISANREADASHFARLESGRHFYVGWFQFVGSILSGAEAARQVAENTWRPDLEKIGEHFSLGFSSKLALVRKPFIKFPLVQLEFTAEVPWVLTTPEPA